MLLIVDQGGKKILYSEKLRDFRREEDEEDFSEYGAFIGQDKADSKLEGGERVRGNDTHRKWPGARPCSEYSSLQYTGHLLHQVSYRTTV